MSVVVLIGTQKGMAILRPKGPSNGQRGAWDVLGLLHKGWMITAATRDAAARYYIAVTHEVWGAAVLFSDDLESWQQLENPPRYRTGQSGNDSHLRIIGSTDPMKNYAEGGRYVDQIWKLLAAGDVLYAGVSEAGVFRSDDRAKTWQVLPGLDEHPGRDQWEAGFGGLCAHSLLCDATSPERLWVGISAAGVFRSDDGGQSFSAKNLGVNSQTGNCVHALTHDPNEADVIYRQDHRGMYRSYDGGDSWKCIEEGLPVSELSDGHQCSFGFPIAMDPGSDAVFAVPLDGDAYRFPRDGKLCVYRTRDGGEQWESLSTGLPDRCYASVLRAALSVDGCDPCGVYFGTSTGTVYGSADLGDSWQELVSGLPRIYFVEAFEE
jgi:hypothetical protein